ncbi:hypothetical protein DV515_00000036 [Chloebia gouldiae]|uniref:Uncharacterized protein n=1 Tax=Chloebia gouldiae TaxID=44316 RepID=A0A3L8T174_CHLGU|nr:hypothetical protein DV515_00000036 [Chloebia gouldiae]
MKVVGPWPALHVSMNKLFSCGRAEFSNDSGCAALWQKRLPLPRQAGTEAFDMCSEAEEGLGQAEHSHATQGKAKLILQKQVQAEYHAVKEETSFVNPSKTSSLQDPNVRLFQVLVPTLNDEKADMSECKPRSPAPVRPETTPTTVPTEKQEVKAPRVRKLTRQYSFDEDDLPPALAAAAAASTPVSSASPGSQKTCTPQTSEGQTQVSPGGKSSTDAGSTFALEPGDLLMDFTEATPMLEFSFMRSTFLFPLLFPVVCAIPGKTWQLLRASRCWRNFEAEFADSKLQCCGVQSSPKITLVSPSPVLRSLAETIPTPTVQTVYTSHKPISLADSAETLRRELEREKMMKRLLMTEL